MRFIKILLLIFTLCPSAVMAAETQDMYYVTARVAKYEDAFQNLDGVECRSFEQSFPNVKSLEVFSQANKCVVKDKADDHIALMCQPNPGPLYDVYMLMSKNYCDKILASAKKIAADNPDIAEINKQAAGEKWFVSEGVKESRTITSCAPSSYDNPDEILSARQRILSEKRGTTVNYICKENDGTHLVFFSRGKKLCEIFNNHMIKDLNLKQIN